MNTIEQSVRVNIRVSNWVSLLSILITIVVQKLLLSGIIRYGVNISDICYGNEMRI